MATPRIFPPLESEPVSLASLARKRARCDTVLRSTSHNLIKSYLNCIDPFATYVDSSPLQVNHSQTNYDVEFGRFYTSGSSTSDAPFTSMAPQEHPTIVNPPSPQYPHCDHKSTQLPDFVYSYSYASLLTFIHSLFEPSSYKEAILDPFWRQTMAKDLSALHKKGTWDIVPLPPRKVLQDLIVLTRSKPNLMGL